MCFQHWQMYSNFERQGPSSSIMHIVSSMRICSDGPLRVLKHSFSFPARAWVLGKEKACLKKCPCPKTAQLLRQAGPVYPTVGRLIVGQSRRDKDKSSHGLRPPAATPNTSQG